jgi:glycosyltransferase involved in cell wall biosynthesis
MRESVSIITPMYNAEKTIEMTIDSVFSQTYSKWELLVVDDQSTDRSVDRVIPYTERDSRVKILQMPKNSGVASARNYGMKNARGRYVAFLDSDDWWKPEKLEVQLQIIKEKKAGLVYSSYFRVDEAGCEKIVPVPEHLDYEQLLKSNQIACLTVLIDTDKTGTFEMEQIRHEDYAAWLTLARKAVDMVGINTPLAYYRVMDKSLSGNKLKSALWTWNIYRKHEKLDFLASMKAFYYYMIRGIWKH